MNRPSHPPRRRHHRTDRGAATVEIVGYMIVVITLLTIGVQMVMWGAAAYAAQVAGDHAAQVARVYGASAADGNAEATLMLASSLGGALRDPTIIVTRTATTVTVEITGHAAPVIAGVAPPVTVTVTVPVERPT